MRCGGGIPHDGSHSMTMIIAYITTLLALSVVDFVWLRFVMRPVFEADVPDLLAAEPNIMAAAIFYAVFSVGLVHFAVNEAVARGAVAIAARDGALIGLLAYATYELTNMATLRDWTWRMVIIDVTWGTVLSAVAAAAGAWAALAFMRA